MASNEEAPTEESLSDLFGKTFALYHSIMDSSEDFRSEEFQNKVRKAILMAEDATRLVSVLDLFSRNEDVSEMPPEHLPFFLLPAAFGSFCE